MIANQNFTMHAGDTQLVSFQVALPDGESLIGSQVEFWLVRYASMFPSGGERLKSTEDPATANDILIPSETSLEILLRPADTTGKSGPFHHLTRITLNGDEVRTIATGTVTIKPAPLVALSTAPVQLAALTLTFPTTIVEASPVGTVVGTFQGRTAGSALSLINTAGGRFALNGPTGAITAGLIPTDRETAASHDITVRETLAEASNSPRDTTLTITVTNVAEVVIATPTLSAMTVAEDAPAGTVVGLFGNLTPGVTGELTDTAGGRFALNSYQLVTTAVGFDYEVAQSHHIVLTLTHADAVAPLSTPFDIQVTGEGSPVLNDLIVISGHSLTDEPMPQMLRRLNEAATGAGVVRLSTLPGSSLAYRRDNGAETYPFNAWAELDGTDDVHHLIMTEAGPIGDSAYLAQPGGTYDDAWDWYRQAVDHNDAPEVTVYEIWPSLDLDDNRAASGVIDLPRWRRLLVTDCERWDGIVADLNDRKAVDEPTVRLLPMGRAWGRLYDEHVNVGLPGVVTDFADAFFIDMIHWTPSSDPGVTGETSYGAYFVACCYFAHAYRQSPVDLPRQLNDQFDNPYPLPPSPTLAAALQAIAWEVVSTEPLAGLNVPTAPVISYAAIHPAPVVGTPVDGLHYVTGYPRPTLTRQWLLDGTPIAGATADTYTAVLADVGKTLAYRVTDPGTSVTRTSPGQVVTDVPVVAAPPSWVGLWMYYSDSITMTFEADLGSAAADRVVVLMLSHQNDNNPFTCTIEGTPIPARATVNPDGSDHRQLFSAVLPAGSGLQTVSITAPSSQWSERFVGVWTLAGVDPVPKQVGLPGAVTTTTIPVEAGDCLLVQGARVRTVLPNQWTFDGSTVPPDGLIYSDHTDTILRMTYATWDEIAATNPAFAVGQASGVGPLLLATFGA